VIEHHVADNRYPAAGESGREIRQCRHREMMASTGFGPKAGVPTGASSRAPA
jgi:hypothetical protein